ncbi:hypothetical protein [Sphingomonas sp. 28-63-12]|uniref:hypothetical protein n=1 Tax=Sphingomonas sp. 28-63-12 TaxID=1970434 RepID=UPI000BD720DA|nr:MAG: hypothetical protein B7Y47_04605 [Sphingomonas sp. 28-63-12]
MNWGILIPIAAVTVGPICWAFTTWVRARHGYPLENRKGGMAAGTGAAEIERQNQLLIAENDQLHGKMARLEERLSVLERIATDPAERTAREIDALR